jgi:membrane protein
LLSTFVTRQLRGVCIQKPWDLLVHRGKAFVALLRAAWVEYEHDRARYLAVAMIYYAVVSLVPLLLLLIGLLGLLLRFSAAVEEVRQRILLGIETSLGTELRITITNLLDTMKAQSITATVVSLVGLVFGASVLFGHLRLAFRTIWKYDPPLVGSARSVMLTTALEKIAAAALVMGGGALLIVALLIIGATQWLGAVQHGLPVSSVTTGWLLKVLSSLLLADITFSLLFKFLPPLPIRWRDVWLAALLCSVTWVVAAEFMAFYGDFFGRNQITYGVIGAILAIMLWMNVISQVLFFGAELCKVIATSKRQSSSPFWGSGDSPPGTEGVDAA